MSELPQDLIFDILSRLPVKCLTRFKSVSKSWYSMIHDPDFVANHLERSRTRRFYLLQAIERIKTPDNRSVFALVQADKLDEAIYVETPNLKISELVGIVDVIIVGSINGLVCLSLNWGKNIVIWNPSTGQDHCVPEAEFLPNESRHHSFGFAEHNGHKVVSLLFDYATDRHLSPTPKVVRADVYDLKTNSWTQIVDPPRVLFSLHTCGPILKGVPYWPTDYGLTPTDKSDGRILLFSPRLNAFSTFKRPNFGEGMYSWRLGKTMENLITFALKENQSIDVWKKLDDQVGDNVRWEKLFTVDAVAGIWGWQWSQAICWKNGGEFIVFMKGDTHYFMYDVWSGECKIFPKARRDDKRRGLVDAFFYTESLVPPCYSS